MTNIRNQMRESLMSLASELAPKVAARYVRSKVCVTVEPMLDAMNVEPH